ncbi:MAG TPA: hypothetical protein VIJ07_20990 [Dermatophilaceae bacterium]
MRTDLQGAHGQAGERLLGACLHRVLVEQSGLPELTPEVHVLDDVEVVAQREVLVDDRDAERVAVLRVVHGDRLVTNSPH